MHLREFEVLLFGDCGELVAQRIELPKIGGGTGKLSDFRGKRVVLFNFASW